MTCTLCKHRVCYGAHRILSGEGCPAVCVQSTDAEQPAKPTANGTAEKAAEGEPKGLPSLGPKPKKNAAA